MLLGSGELGKEVLIALQRLGVETIAVDRYENAPGQQVAHHARTITMSDPQALKALIEAERPHLVVPEIEAIATPMLEELEAAGTVRVIPTARAARLTMDREGIRRLAAETLKLPTSPYVFCDSLAELQAAIDGSSEEKGIGYPCIVKPVMSSSGKGQSKIDGPADVNLAAQSVVAGAFILLLCGFLAERVDARFGSPRACAAALATVVLAAGLCALGGVLDMRPLLLLQLLPVLLIPAGALSLPGRHTRKADWLLILGLYAAARVCDLGDTSVMRITGGAISGHALMHLCLTAVAAWLAYRASTASAAVSAAGDAGLTQANTSLSTSGWSSICTWAEPSTCRLCAPGNVAVEAGNTMLSQ